MELNDQNVDAALTLRPFPRVTKESIEARIRYKTWARIGRKVTVCVITMVNGYEVVGHSACVDERNFDEAIGKHYAYEAAFEQLWPLEGYLLAEQQRDDK